MHPHEHALFAFLRICAIAFVFVAGLAAATTIIAWRYLERNDPPTGCNGSPLRGRQLVVAYGCVGCHDVPGAAPRGDVGPTLRHIGTRVYIAGHFANEPIMMAAWLRNPDRLKPGTAMPNLGVGERDARDMTAYLATLK